MLGLMERWANRTAEEGKAGNKCAIGRTCWCLRNNAASSRLGQCGPNLGHKHTLVVPHEGKSSIQVFYPKSTYTHTNHICTHTGSKESGVNWGPAFRLDRGSNPLVHNCSTNGPENPVKLSTTGSDSWLYVTTEKTVYEHDQHTAGKKTHHSLKRKFKTSWCYPFKCTSEGERNSLEVKAPRDPSLKRCS